MVSRINEAGGGSRGKFYHMPRDYNTSHFVERVMFSCQTQCQSLVKYLRSISLINIYEAGDIQVYVAEIRESALRYYVINTRVAI